MYNSLSNIYLQKVLLTEFTEAAITAFAKRFQEQSPLANEEQIRYNIEKFDRVKNAPRFVQITKRFFPNISNPLDPQSYQYSEFETVLNWFGGEKESKESAALLPEEQPGTDPIVRYDDGVLVIYTIYTHEQAQKLVRTILPQITNGKTYSYCIQDASGFYWRNYRFDGGQTFYVVVDKSKNFKTDVNSVLVIRPYWFLSQNKKELKYKLSDAINKDREESWESIIALQPKLENKKDIFVARAYSTAEIIQKDMGSKLAPEKFANISYQAKKMYITLGNQIYAKDYEILDKDLQNAYINAQSNKWGEVTLSKKTGSIPYYTGFYPFIEQQDVGHIQKPLLQALTQMLLAMIYIKQENKILEFVPVIAKSSNMVVKRYLEFLTRNKQDIVSKTYLEVIQFLPILRSFLQGCKENLDAHMAEGTEGVFYKIVKEFDFLSLLTEDQKEVLVTSRFLLTTIEFLDLSEKLKMLYIDTWFTEGSEGEFFTTKNSFEFFSTKTNVLNFLLDSNTENIWENIFENDDLEDVINSIPVFTNSTAVVKKYFLTKLTKYCDSVT